VLDAVDGDRLVDALIDVWRDLSLKLAA